MPLSPADFTYVSTLMRDQAALVLDSEKAYRIEACLLPLARREGCADVGELIGKLRSTTTNGMHRKVVEAMTINETSFFRDGYPFEALRREVIPDMIRRRERDRRLDVWCGASSTGQEPYSIAMLLREHFPQLGGWSVRLVGSDLSEAVLERARQARYSQLEVNRGLPAPLLARYFTRQGLEWQLKDEVRRLVEFRAVNLVEPWPHGGLFDVVFLRNVLIYFDVETKKRLLERVHGVLRPGGVLFLGGAETTLQLSTSYERVPFERQAYYRARDN